MKNRVFIFAAFLLLITMFTTAYITVIDTKNNKNIVLGASLPLSGINQDLGNEIIEGANSYFSHINAKGGIREKFIQFIFYDDKYEPQNTLINIEELLNVDKAFALFGFVGTPTAKKVLPIVVDTEVPFIAPYTGASFLRDLNIPNIINFRASYEQEIEGIVNYFYNKKNITRFAIFYQNDGFGEEGYIALTKALEKRELSLVAEGTYKRNTLSITHALHEIKRAKPQAIIIVGAYKPSARFITKAKECCAKDIIFAPISFVNSDALIRELDYNGENIIFSQTVPPYDDHLEAAKEYRELLNFYYPTSKPTYVSFEAFLAAKTVVKALENIDGILDRSNFLESLKNLDKDTLNDIPIEYKNSQLLNKTYLLDYKNNKFNVINQEEL